MTTETQIQKFAAKHFRQLEETLKTFTFFSVPGGSVRIPPHIGKQLKDMGVRAGVPDFVFLYHDKKPIFIELKTQGRRASDAQKIFFKILDSLKQPNYLIDVESGHDAVKTITGILRAEGVLGV